MLYWVLCTLVFFCAQTISLFGGASLCCGLAALGSLHGCNRSSLKAGQEAKVTATKTIARRYQRYIATGGKETGIFLVCHGGVPKAQPRSTLRSSCRLRLADMLLYEKRASVLVVQQICGTNLAHPSKNRRVRSYLRNKRKRSKRNADTWSRRRRGTAAGAARGPREARATLKKERYRRRSGGGGRQPPHDPRQSGVLLLLQIVVRDEQFGRQQVSPFAIRKA